MVSRNSALRRYRSPRPAGAIPVLLLMLTAVPIASPAEVLGRSGSTFEFLPGVVVDPERAVVYVMSPEGSIDAVDLASGKLLWRTARAAKPLLRHEDRLLAQTEPPAGGESLRIALLDIHDIDADPRFVEVPLPAGVQATIDDQMESSFSAAARVHEGVVVLSWRFTYRPVTGPPPGPEEQALGREAEGRVRIDIHSGQIDPIDERAALPEPELPPALARLKEAQALSGPVWRIGKVFVTIVRATSQGEQRVSLKRWDAETGEALAEVTLFDGGLGFRSVSADQRHLLASRRDTSDGRIWTWAIFSLETGAKVAELRHDTPGQRFFLFGARLIHETNVSYRRAKGQVVIEPAKLRAVDLETGTELWSHAIRDTKYRGPYPPRTTR